MEQGKLSGVISFACRVQYLKLQKSNNFFSDWYQESIKVKYTLLLIRIIENEQTVSSLALTEIFLTSDTGDFLVAQTKGAHLSSHLYKGGSTIIKIVRAVSL